VSDSLRKRFDCRHCGKLIFVDGKKHLHEGEHLNLGVVSQGVQIESYVCNECGKINICISTKHYGTDMKEVPTAKGKIKDMFVFPVNTPPVNIKYVPKKYLNEYNEARWLRDVSPKACALICRRIMEIILENDCNCTKFNLSEKLIEFEAKYKPTTFLMKSLQYIIGAGNAVAHNKKDLNDDLITIKSNDCDALLEAVRMLFDTVFVLPQKESELAKRLKKVEPKKRKGQVIPVEISV